MKNQKTHRGGDVRKTAQLGEVVAAAFDKAAHYSADPGEVLFLAAQAVTLILRRQQISTPNRTCLS